MKTFAKPLILAGLLAVGAPQAVFAQAAPAVTGNVVVKGLGVANLDAVVANSNAFKTAEAQRPTTYKAQIDQANTRAQAIQAQLKPLADKFEADRKAPTPNQAALQQQYAQIQQIQQAGQQEIERILAPVQLSRAYVEEQVGDKLDVAVKAAMNSQKVSIILTPASVVAAEQAYNMNQAILNELNTVIPSAQLVPPQGWLPRQAREQQAAAAAQQGQAPAPAPAPANPKAPSGR